MAVSGPWQSGSGIYIDWGSGWVAVAHLLMGAEAVTHFFMGAVTCVLVGWDQLQVCW